MISCTILQDYKNLGLLKKKKKIYFFIVWKKVYNLLKNNEGPL